MSPAPSPIEAGTTETLARVRLIAFLALLLGAAAIAFAPILVRLSDTSPTASAFWRVALAAPVLWAWALAVERRACGAGIATRPGAATGRDALPGMALAGLFFACDLGAWHVSIAWTSVANATLEANFAPIFVTLGAWLLWRQRPSAMFIVALVVTIGGAVLLIGPNFNAGGRALQGDLLGILTGMFYAGYMLSIKSVAGRIPTAHIMAISTTVSALLLAPYAGLTAEHFLPQAASGWTGWLVLAALAIVPHIAGQSLIAFGFAHLPASLSSVSLLLQAVLAALYAWVLLGEAMQPVQMAGGLIVLAGIYIARRAS
ncbi:MAG: DMT family transporter [Betaproteobacteria bacterium]|nr:DMT family transporter [Betaproteobacteria bacterium]